MGKQSNRAARRRQAQRKVLAPGVTKDLLDHLHHEAVNRWGVGLGVIVQEEDRASAIVASLRCEYRDTPWWAFRLKARRAAALADARGTHQLWIDRLTELTGLVPDEHRDKLKSLYEQSRRV